VVHVVNVRVVGREGVEYVGRPSVLGNPFKLSRHASPAERAEVIEHYRRWLRQQCQAQGHVQRELDRLAQRHRSNGLLVLGCWCAPLPCHADVIRETVLSLLKKGGNHGKKQPD
jgi:hypothetical protein